MGRENFFQRKQRETGWRREGKGLIKDGGGWEEGEEEILLLLSLLCACLHISDVLFYRWLITPASSSPCVHWASLSVYAHPRFSSCISVFLSCTLLCSPWILQVFFLFLDFNVVVLFLSFFVKYLQICIFLLKILDICISFCCSYVCRCSASLIITCISSITAWSCWFFSPKLTRSSLRIQVLNFSFYHKLSFLHFVLAQTSY